MAIQALAIGFCYSHSGENGDECKWDVGTGFCGLWGHRGHCEVWQNTNHSHHLENVWSREEVNLYDDFKEIGKYIYFFCKSRRQHVLLKSERSKTAPFFINQFAFLPFGQMKSSISICYLDVTWHVLPHRHNKHKGAQRQNHFLMQQTNMFTHICLPCAREFVSL